jgi:hypothetical protein
MLGVDRDAIVSSEDAAGLGLACGTGWEEMSLANKGEEQSERKADEGAEACHGKMDLMGGR